VPAACPIGADTADIERHYDDERTARQQSHSPLTDWGAGSGPGYAPQTGDGPDLRIRTPVDSLDSRHETTDQKAWPPNDHAPTYAWNESWNRSPENPGALGAVTAPSRGIGAGSGDEAGEHASRNASLEVSRVGEPGRGRIAPFFRSRRRRFAPPRPSSESSARRAALDKAHHEQGRLFRDVMCSISSIPLSTSSAIHARMNAYAASSSPADIAESLSAPGVGRSID
jgi:hypothetical protein